MSREYQIVPYAVHDGVPSFRDSEIEGWFERLRSEGSVRWLFFDGMVTDAREFVRLVKTPGVFFFTVWAGRDEPAGAEMVGVFWIRDFIGNAAHLHHAIFKKFWGSETKMIGRHVLEYILAADGEEGRLPLVGVLLGITPVNNISAVKFAKAVGMERLGTVPGMLYDIYANCAVDGVMSCMTQARCKKTETKEKQNRGGDAAPTKKEI